MEKFFLVDQHMGVLPSYFRTFYEAPKMYTITEVQNIWTGIGLSWQSACLTYGSLGFEPLHYIKPRTVAYAY